MSEGSEPSCIFCLEKFRVLSDLKKHYKELHKNESKNEEIIPCDICSETFVKISSAITHKFKKHKNNNEKYYCAYCGMLFPIKYFRDKHILTHVDEEKDESNYSCSDCNEIFYTAEGHQYHSKNHKQLSSLFQQIVIPPPSKKIKFNNAKEAQSVYYCHLCGIEYIVKYNLQKHLQSNHQNELNNLPSNFIKCTICEALFYNSRAYKHHLISHRPGDLYVTSEQHRLETISRVDQDFDYRRVAPKNQRSKKYQKVEIKAEEVEVELSPPESDSDDDKHELPSTSKEQTTNSKIFEIFDSNGRRLNAIPNGEVLKFTLVKIPSTDETIQIENIEQT